MLAVGSALLVSHAPSFSSLFTPLHLFSLCLSPSFAIISFYLSSLSRTNQPPFFSFQLILHSLHSLTFLRFSYFPSLLFFLFIGVLSNTNIISRWNYIEIYPCLVIFTHVCVVWLTSVLLITTLLRFEERIQITFVIFVSWLFLLYSLKGQ